MSVRVLGVNETALGQPFTIIEYNKRTIHQGITYIKKRVFTLKRAMYPCSSLCVYICENLASNQTLTSGIFCYGFGEVFGVNNCQFCERTFLHWLAGVLVIT